MWFMHEIGCGKLCSSHFPGWKPHPCTCAFLLTPFGGSKFLLTTHRELTWAQKCNNLSFLPSVCIQCAIFFSFFSFLSCASVPVFHDKFLPPMQESKSINNKTIWWHWDNEKRCKQSTKCSPNLHAASLFCAVLTVTFGELFVHRNRRKACIMHSSFLGCQCNMVFASPCRWHHPFPLLTHAVPPRFCQQTPVLCWHLINARHQVCVETTSIPRLCSASLHHWHLSNHKVQHPISHLNVQLLVHKDWCCQTCFHQEAWNKNHASSNSLSSNPWRKF